MLAELERGFISERIKECLRARVTQGIKLSKPKGVFQASMYDKDRDKIMYLHQLDVSIQKIIAIHLGYGKYLSRKVFIHKCREIK